MTTKTHWSAPALKLIPAAILIPCESGVEETVKSSDLWTTQILTLRGFPSTDDDERSQIWRSVKEVVTQKHPPGTMKTDLKTNPSSFSERYLILYGWRVDPSNILWWYQSRWSIIVGAMAAFSSSKIDILSTGKLDVGISLRRHVS